MAGLKGLMGPMMLKGSLAWGKIGGESPCKSDISSVHGSRSNGGKRDKNNG